MRHNYTNDDLLRATTAAKEAISNPYKNVPLAYLNHFLDALPEPQDEWEACAFEDIQEGDRVKWFYRDKDRENTCIGVAHRLAYANEAWVTENGAVVADISVQGQFYRIPAPVQHPGPLEHPVIYVKECDIVGFIPKIMVWYRDSYVAGQQCLSPEQITEWRPIDPTKMVADND